MTVLDLFSGIGGLALGFERAGFQVGAFCEQDDYARAVLRRHWPDIPCYDDVRTLTAQRLLQAGVAAPSLICGGFPCQDVSTAGRGAGLEGSRSILWWHMLRLVRELRPAWVVAENVPGLRVRGADQVLEGLEAAGYACWPLLVGAAHAGAPHRRQRVFILAHAQGARLEAGQRGPAYAPPCLHIGRRGGWAAEPGLGRVVDGLPTRMDRRRRLTALGNAVVPAVAEAIGVAIRTSGLGELQAAVERTRSANVLRNFATFGATTARQ